MTRVFEGPETRLFIRHLKYDEHLETLPQISPMPALMPDRANLLALYNLTATRAQRVTHGHGGNDDWIIHVAGSQVRPPLLLLLSDSIEIWIAEIKDWLNPPLDRLILAHQGILRTAPSKRRHSP